MSLIQRKRTVLPLERLPVLHEALPRFLRASVALHPRRRRVSVLLAEWEHR